MSNVTLSDLEAVNINGLPRGRGFCKDIATGNLLWDDGETITFVSNNQINQSPTVVMIGNSNTQANYIGWKSVDATANVFGIEVPYTTGSGITADQTVNGGTITYTHVTRSITWQCIGDVGPGPAITAKEGLYQLESASANLGIMIGIRSLNSLTQDRTITVKYTGTPTLRHQARAIVNNILQMSGQPYKNVINLGLQSLRAAEAATPGWINFYKSKLTGIGPADLIIDLCDNDISDDVDTDSAMLGYVTTIVDALKGYFNKIKIVGLQARYKTGTTSMDSTQLNKTLAVNAGLYNYCVANGFEFIETFNITRDQTKTNGDPKPGMLLDHVHNASPGSSLIAQRAQKPAFPIIEPVDPNNLYAHLGYMQGQKVAASGTNGNSGFYPAGFSGAASRALGVDVTCAQDVISMDGIEWWKWTITSTADNQRIDANTPNLALPATISQAGKTINAGDKVYLEIDVKLENIVRVLPELFLFISGDANRYVCANFESSAAGAFSVTATPLDNGYRRLRTPVVTIPIGATAIRPFIVANVGANASGSLYWTNLKFYKVS